jgi:hypothetical protein
VSAAVVTAERAAQMIERLHKSWHPAPSACTRPCPELTRAHSVVHTLGPLLAQYVTEEIERAEAALRKAWGQ